MANNRSTRAGELAAQPFQFHKKLSAKERTKLMALRNSTTVAN